MRFFVVLLFFVTVLLSQSCGSDNKGSEEKKQASSGYAIFKKHCVTCHGADGRMGLNGAKPIPDSKMSLEERITHISNGKGTMQPYKGILSAEQIKAVAEYTFEVGKEKQ